MSNSDNGQYDIIIVGGGLVGATMACLLGRMDVRVALVDRSVLKIEDMAIEKPQPAFDARVSALTVASTELFTALGIWDEIKKQRVCDYRDMHVWDADGTGSIHFSAAQLNEPTLGAIVENSLIQSALFQKLAKQPRLDIITPFTIDKLQRQTTDGQALWQLMSREGQSISGKLVIAADGGNSRVRELADFASKEWDYNHQALVTTVCTELPHQHTALQRFMDTGPLAFLPLLSAADAKDQHYCSIVWSSLPEKTAALMAMSDKRFNSELSGAIENRLGNVDWSDRRFAFPLKQRHATSYAKDSIVLVGDAAHTIHPLAGQGVNLGLLDVKVLAEELEQGVAAGRSLEDPVLLQRYQRRRRGHNLGMMWLMEGFKHLFAEQALPVRWLRNSGMKQIDNLGLIKNHLAKRAMGLD